MFGLKARLVKPEPYLVSVSEDTSEYEILANRLGIIITNVQTNKFLNFMANNDLPMYHLPTVIKYMNGIVKRAGDDFGWLWRAIRSKDMDIKIDWGVSKYDERFASDYHEGNRNIGLYQLPIPIRVLKRIEYIELRSPLKSKFFISDYATKDEEVLPDPFLLVWLPEIQQRYVVDFWDEPSFGIKEMLAG